VKYPVAAWTTRKPPSAGKSLSPWTPVSSSKPTARMSAAYLALMFVVLVVVHGNASAQGRGRPHLDCPGPGCPAYSCVFSYCEDQAERLQSGPNSHSSFDDFSLGVLRGEAPSPRHVVHSVRKGETLSSIAKMYYGDPNAYVVIFEANVDRLISPDLIFPGEQLLIPTLSGPTH
jgi:nucleoid-associated protein YgaU